MNVTEFLSGNLYVVLPNKCNARVYLSIGNKATTRLSFNLYNPFSKKAKTLKILTRFLCLYCKSLAKLILPNIESKKSDFVEFLEKKLKKGITTSVYLATEKDKVVLQLQHKQNVVGYLKLPMTPLGERRLLKERKAIKILSRLNLVPAILFEDRFRDTPFLVLQNLEGVIGHVNEKEYQPILNAFKKEKRFKLKDHPRIRNLNNELRENNLNEQVDLLNRVVASSKKHYHEVFEHGDLAPWNLIKTKEGLVPFDFEYFEEHGLEYLDEVKYHFQIYHLLHKKEGYELIQNIKSKMNLKEFKIIFLVFLLKEIINKCLAKNEYDFENSLIVILRDE